MKQARPGPPTAAPRRTVEPLRSARGPMSLDRALQERRKELRCLYGVVELADRHGLSAKEFVQGVADLLPSGWQYSEAAAARIEHEGEVFVSPGFEEGPCRQAAAIVVNGRPCGSVEVFYTEEKPAADEGPFLREERELIKAIAQKVGAVVDRIRAEEAIRKAHERLAVEGRALHEANAALRVVLARIEEEKAAIKGSMVANINKIVMPLVLALEAEIEPEKRGYVTLIRRNLEEIASPLLDDLSRQFMALTPAELKVCNMIQMGMRTKEIAELRGISPATVNRQRESIRRKLGLAGKRANLTSFVRRFQSSGPPRSQSE
ncbi:LuxR C-terminal-related transcriptional regulator [Candidatus Binatia bacterium]|nr:LuxR C-terminal-related transcriptional regulator [Candidatus Binatia bacterium]